LRRSPIEPGFLPKPLPPGTNCNSESAFTARGRFWARSAPRRPRRGVAGLRASPAVAHQAPLPAQQAEIAHRGDRAPHGALLTAGIIGKRRLRGVAPADAGQPLQQRGADVVGLVGKPPCPLVGMSRKRKRARWLRSSLRRELGPKTLPPCQGLGCGLGKSSGSSLAVAKARQAGRGHEQSRGKEKCFRKRA